MTVSNTKMGYGITDTNYTVGAVGEITDNGNPASNPTIVKEVVTQIGTNNLSGDPRVLGFRHGANERALVVSYRYSGWTPLAPEFLICDPAQKTGGKWNVVKTLSHSDWSQLSNPYGVAALGNNLFVADYDNACIARIDMTNNAYSQTTPLFFPFPAITYNSITYQSHCASIGLASVGGSIRLVALFNHSANSYQNYLPSTLAFVNPNDGTATYLGPTAANPSADGLNKNAVGMTVTGGYAYVSSYGGMQQGGGNENSKLEIVQLAATPGITRTYTVAATGGLGDFVGTAISPDGSIAYVLSASYTTSYTQYNWRVYRATAATLQNGTGLRPDIGPVLYGMEPPAAGSGYPGVTWMVALESSRLWFVCGDRIRGIDAANNNAQDFVKTAAAPDLGISPRDGHLNTAAIVQHGVSNTAVQHPAFASRTPAALKLRKDLLEEVAATKE